MPDDTTTKTFSDEEECTETSKDCVGRLGTFLLILSNAVLVLLVIYVLAKLWPYPTPSFEPPGSDRPVATETPPTDTNAVTLEQQSEDQDTAPPDTTRVDTVATRAAPIDTAAARRAREVASEFIPIWLECDKRLSGTFRRLSAREVPDYSTIPKCVNLFGGSVAIWDEQRLLFMVLLAGALGALVHAIRSLSMYVGRRQLKKSWVPYYVLMPFGGAAIALIFYLVIRGGFFAPTTDFKDTNAFAFTALGALVGLFSQSAILKLKKIAENIFEPEEEKKDSLDPKKPTGKTPVITTVERKAQVEGGREDTVNITGSNFTASSKVDINGKPRPAVFEGATLLTITLEAPELAILENGGELRIVVINDNQRSNEIVLS